jgi:hypothetical protein
MKVSEIINTNRSMRFQIKFTNDGSRNIHAWFRRL